jgi:hypothetical protein
MQGAAQGRALFAREERAPPTVHVASVQFQTAGLMHTRGQGAVSSRPFSREVESFSVRRGSGVFFKGQAQMVAALAVEQLKSPIASQGAGYKDQPRLRFLDRRLGQAGDRQSQDR